MKKSKLPKSLLVTLAAPALLALAVPAGQVFAQGQTETKIRLMADALRARDSGDLETAKKNLEELLALAPNDATVQRLLSGVNASIAARASGLVQADDAALAPTSEPVAVTMPTVVRTTPAPVLTPEEAAVAQADDLAKQEDLRIRGLIADARVKRAEARRLAKDGRFDEAASVLDGAINSLPSNPATASTIVDLQAEKNGLLLEKAQYALRQGDTAGARAALDAYAATSANDRRTERVARSIDAVELNPPLQPIEEVNPRFIADQKEVAKLVAKGRSQYLAGDIDGAQETFRLLESVDAGSPEAKSFLTRIANERARVSELNRVKTRAQLIQEVGEAWNRPGIYLDRVVTPGGPDRITPLAQKLNTIIIPNVNFSGVEMSRVISTLSAISDEYDRSEGVKGVNIVLEDQATKNPPVTITLRNLSLKRILDLITSSNGYTYEVTEDTVLVRQQMAGEGRGLDNAFFPVTRATVIRMTGIGAAAASPAASADPFAAPSAAPSGGGGGGGESGALQAFLEQAGVPFQGIQGASLVYDGAAIIVNQTPRNIEKIRNILNRYNDVRQVEIETKFLDVQQGVLDELGVNWSVNGQRLSFVSGNRSLASAFASTSAASEGQIVRLGAPTLGVSNNPATPPGSVDIGNTASGIVGNPVSGFDYGSGANSAFAVATGVVGEFDVTATIRALSRQTGTDLMSAPKVTVLSGNPANIVIAQELRYPQSYGEIQSQVGTSGNGGGGAAGVTITAGTPQEFTTRNVGVELKVTPTVEEDDYSISLDLNPKVTEFEGFVEYGGQSVAISGGTTVTMPSGFFQPIFSTREVTTKVTVWDGATLVMGGLTREEVRKVNDKIPVLGDIPFFGRAFRSSGETSSKRNLLIFVTANLVTPGGSPKKQQLKYTSPAAIFQNPTMVTPAAAESRARSN